MALCAMLRNMAYSENNVTLIGVEQESGERWAEV